MGRTILHIDLDAFFCAVEEQRDPALEGLPFAVGGRPETRGVVASCSYAARRFGVHSAMPMRRAVMLCPDLVIVPQHFDAYHAASRRVMEILHQKTPLVEQLSIDEAFMDVTGRGRDGGRIAADLQAQINQELKLPCSLGVASNKLVAKIANTVGKSEQSAKVDGSPNAIKVVLPGQEAAFLAPLPVRELWGIGPKTAERLRKMDVKTIGDLTRLHRGVLEREFGKLGGELYDRARGLDNRPVVTEQETKSISKEITFAQDVRDEDRLVRVVREMSDGIGWRLRREGLRGHTVRIKLRWSDFTTLSRQVTLPQSIDQDEEIFAAAHDMFKQHWTKGRPERLIGVGISGFDEHARQLGLWGQTKEVDRQLQNTLDNLKNRFGEAAIQRGTTLRRNKTKFEDDLDSET